MSSKIPRSRLAAVIAERFLQNVGAEQLAREIAAYLLEEGRGSELDSILRDVLQYRADRGIVEALAVSAYPISEAVRQDIEGVLRELYPSARQLIVSESRDATVIGGVKIVLANQQLDLSVRHKLSQFRQLTAAPGGVSA